MELEETGFDDSVEKGVVESTPTPRVAAARLAEALNQKIHPDEVNGYVQLGTFQGQSFEPSYACIP